MLYKVKKRFPMLAKFSAFFYLIIGGWFFQSNYNPVLVTAIVISVILVLVSSVFSSLKLNWNSKRVHHGYFLLGFFKSNYSFSIEEFKEIKIQKQPDKYFGIGVELKNGDFVLLDKIPTLDKATERKDLITLKVNKLIGHCLPENNKIIV